VVGKIKIQNLIASWAVEEKHQFMRNLALPLFLQLLPFGLPVAATRPCSSELMTSSWLHASLGKICTYIQASSFKKSVCIGVHTPSLCFLSSVKSNFSEQDENL